MHSRYPTANERCSTCRVVADISGLSPASGSSEARKKPGYKGKRPLSVKACPPLTGPSTCGGAPRSTSSTLDLSSSHAAEGSTGRKHVELIHRAPAVANTSGSTMRVLAGSYGRIAENDRGTIGGSARDDVRPCSVNSAARTRLIFADRSPAGVRQITNTIAYDTLLPGFRIDFRRFSRAGIILNGSCSGFIAFTIYDRVEVV